MTVGFLEPALRLVVSCGPAQLDSLLTYILRFAASRAYDRIRFVAPRPVRSRENSPRSPKRTAGDADIDSESEGHGSGGGAAWKKRKGAEESD